MDYSEMLFALQVHQIVDKQLREDAARNQTNFESFATKERYEEYVMHAVRQLATTAEIVRHTPLGKGDQTN